MTVSGSSGNKAPFTTFCYGNYLGLFYLQIPFQINSFVVEGGVVAQLS